MKKILVLSFIFVYFIGNAQIPEDSVIMTIAGKQVSLAEFEFIARKNNEVDFSNEKSLKEYVELFKNFKLKVAEAESLGLDKSRTFINELAGYETQLKGSYFKDRKAEEEYAKTVFDRAQEYLEISQILFPIEGPHSSKDTIAVYEQAMKVYERIQKGEDFDTVGKELYNTYKQYKNDPEKYNEKPTFVIYEDRPCLLPLDKSLAFEEKAYSMSVGEISSPFRTVEGFHLLKIKNRKPYPGIYHVAAVLIGLENDSIKRTEDEALIIAEEVYNKALNGADFTELVNEYSSDKFHKNGILPPVKPGLLVKRAENTVYSLTQPGEISKPILTELGFYIFKLIKIQHLTFEKEKDDLIVTLSRDERNFNLYRGFDERLKKEYNYQFFPEAYAELEKLAEEYFPSSNEFFTKARSMEKTLVILNGMDFPQVELAYYMNKFPYSAKTYAGDFMQEVFDLFIRDIVTTFERQNMLVKHPEIPHLIQEYRDGLLLFEICNTEIWNKPLEEQPALEQNWIKELNKKYPVKINQKLLKKLKKN